MVKQFIEDIFKKWILGTKKVWQSKTQYVQNATTARYHQQHGKKVKVNWKIFFHRVYD